MKFNLTERVQLAIILPNPQRETFLTQKILKGLRKKLYPTPEEIELYEIKSIENKVNENLTNVSYDWNDEGNKVEFDIEFDKYEYKYLNELLNKLSKEKDFPSSLTDLCDNYFEMDLDEDIDTENKK